MPAKLAHPMQKKLTDGSFPTSKLTIHEAAALRSSASVVRVKCNYRTKRTSPQLANEYIRMFYSRLARI